MQGNWVEENGGTTSRIDAAGDICLRRPRPIQGCRTDDDDKKHTLQKQKTNTSLLNTLITDAKVPKHQVTQPITFCMMKHIFIQVLGMDLASHHPSGF
jgi:hypothetical protein